MTATAFEDVIQKAVKKGKGVKDEVLEEIEIEEELEKEHEIDKEVEKRIRDGKLSKIEYPHGDKAQPVTMVRNPEDEVYGNLPMSFKVDISDAVNFVEAWDNAKPTDMRAAFMQSHLTNKVKDEYFDELRKRLEVAKRQGHTQVIMPTPNQDMMEEMESKSMNKSTKDEKGSNDDLAATLAPLLTLQKIMGEDSKSETQEKPTEIVKSIMETAKGLSEGKETQEKPTELIKEVIEVAKELNASKGDTSDPAALVTAIMSAAEAMSQSKQPAAQPNQDILQQITAVSELTKALSSKNNGGGSEEKIQVPRDDGSIMEMTVQQYMLSEILRSKLSNEQPQQPAAEQKQQYETIQIKDPDGTIRTMPATTYISEIALKQINEKERQTGKTSSEVERVSQDSTKLMAALVSTVERLSTEVNGLKARDAKDDPIRMMDEMLAQGEKIDNFRRRFLGGGLTEEDKKREEEEIEKQRAHELKLEQMKAQQANRTVLTSILSEEGTTEQATKQQPPQAEAQSDRTREKEAIRQSQRKAEQMIENMARERALAEKLAEEEVGRQKVRQHTRKKAEEVETPPKQQERKGKRDKAVMGDTEVRTEMKEEEIKDKEGVKK